MKRTLIMLVTLMLLLAGCSNSKYKVSSNSEINKSDLKLLQKSFNQLEQNERTRLITMESDMTDEERAIFKDDFKRLYIEEMKEVYGSPEKAGQMFEESWEHETRKRKGGLTEEEKEREDYYEEVAEAAVGKSNDFFNAEIKLQEVFKEKQERDDRIIKLEVIDKSSYRESFDISLKVRPIKEIKIFEINNIRNEIVDEVRKVIETKEVKVELYMGEEYKDTYIFTNGWDKEVTP